MGKLKFIIVILGMLTYSVSTFSQDKMTREEYIQKYKSIVIEHMDIYGIPASIKMAQALLESSNGNSRLAVEANNHFGIKCKTTWTGETISHDDDSRGECFRKYNSAEESFKDHSEFLDKSPRYQDLFKLDPIDYKGWAYGLKKAGYATLPTYAEALIKIIEDNQLYRLDEGGALPSDNMYVENQKENNTAPETVKPKETAPEEKVDIDNYSVSVKGSNNQHAVYQNNGSQFVVAAKGDTYESIAREFRLTPKKLYTYNDVSSGNQLKEGEMVYIKTKASRSHNAKLIHIAKDGETMHSISQIYGIKLSKLVKLNRRPKDSLIKAGQQIRLM